MVGGINFIRIMRKIGNKFILAVSLLIVLGALAVVYATLLTILNIEGSGTTKQLPVEINNFIKFVSAEKVNEGSSGDLTIVDNLTVTISNIKLTESEREVVYKVTVKNVYKDESTDYGTNAYLKSINTPMTLNNGNVEVKVKHADWGDRDVVGYDNADSGYAYLGSEEEQTWKVIVSYVGDNLGNADIQPFTIKTEWTDTNS